MSWTSRFGSLGRFSPFSRSPPQGPTRVSDADFSYITDEDLKFHHNASTASNESPTDYGPPRDTDVLVLRNKKQEYPVHFPAYSIAKGELKIGQVREHAAKKLGTSDPRRIKLLHRGKNLQDDQRTCKQEGLKDGAEILCTVAETITSSSGTDDDDDEFGVNAVTEGGSEGKKRRNRGKKTKRRAKREQSELEQTPDAGPSIPPPSTRPTVPTTPIEKLNALADTLDDFESKCNEFFSRPPSDPAKREFEYKRLSESILTTVLIKLDSVETEGDTDARLRRKGLVKDAQALLAKLDAAHKQMS